MKPVNVVPAKDVPILRPTTAEGFAAAVGDRTFSIDESMIKGETDAQIRARLVCLRRPEMPDCEDAEKVAKIVIRPAAANRVWFSAKRASEVDPGCVALEAKKLEAGY